MFAINIENLKKLKYIFKGYVCYIFASLFCISKREQL